MKFPKSLISRLYFSYACECEINQYQFLCEALEEPTYNLISSGDDYSSCILEDDNVVRNIAYVAKEIFHQNGHPICFSHVEFDCTIIVYNHLLGEETIWIMPPLRKILISFILNCHFSPPISPTARDIFNLTEWEGMMSSPCILNMKHLESLKNNTRRLQLP